jgi:ABC-type transport system substrate-binding protein
MIFLGTGVAAAQSKVYLKIGILKEPKTLNPFQATDAWTKRVIGLLYQPLYIREPDTLALVPWLAEGQPIFDAQRKTLTIHLRQMKWDDGSEFGAEDVVFTGETLRKFRVPKYYDHWIHTNPEELDRPEKTMGAPYPKGREKVERNHRDAKIQGKGRRKGP